MSLPELTFELPASQYELIGFPGLRQGQPLDVVFDGGVLFPDSGAATWFSVQPHPLPTHLVEVMRGHYAFSGQIKAAEIIKANNEESAILLINCGNVPIRVTCAPQEDGTLPWGTWETRYLTGIAPVQGILEEDFATSIGETVGVTIWSIHRLVLTPGDPNFGRWFETDSLPSSPYRADRIYLTVRVHPPQVIQHR